MVLIYIFVNGIFIFPLVLITRENYRGSFPLFFSFLKLSKFLFQNKEIAPLPNSTTNFTNKFQALSLHKKMQINISIQIFTNWQWFFHFHSEFILLNSLFCTSIYLDFVEKFSKLNLTRFFSLKIFCLLWWKCKGFERLQWFEIIENYSVGNRREGQVKFRFLSNLLELRGWIEVFLIFLQEFLIAFAKKLWKFYAVSKNGALGQINYMYRLYVPPEWWLAQEIGVKLIID